MKQKDMLSSFLSPTPLKVSLPLSAFTESSCSSLQSLGRRLEDIRGLPKGQLGAVCHIGSIVHCAIYLHTCILIHVLHVHVYSMFTQYACSLYVSMYIHARVDNYD